MVEPRRSVFRGTWRVQWLIDQTPDLLLQGQLALFDVLKAFKGDLFTSSLAESSTSPLHTTCLSCWPAPRDTSLTRQPSPCQCRPSRSKLLHGRLQGKRRIPCLLEQRQLSLTPCPWELRPADQRIFVRPPCRWRCYTRSSRVLVTEQQRAPGWLLICSVRTVSTETNASC